MKLNERHKQILYISQLTGLGVLGFLLAYFKDVYGNISIYGELAINFSIILLLEILVTVLKIGYDLRNNYMFLPHGMKEGGNIDLLNIFQGLITKAADDYGEPKISMIRACIKKQLMTFENDLKNSGRARFYTQDISSDSIQDLFYEGVKDTDEIHATCFTEMDDFWFADPIGGEFLRVNLELLKRNEKRMKRVFAVQDDYWENGEIKKRELIRLLMSKGCKCRIITARKIKELGLSSTDMFIVVSHETVSFGFEWILSSASGDSSTVLLTFREKELNKLNLDFTDLWRRSEPIPAYWSSEYKLQIPATEAATRAYLERLYNYKSSKFTNMTQYLRSASAHADSVAKYWKGLDGTIIRPSTATVTWMKQKLPNTAVPQAKVGILGSTPELRKLAAEHFKNSVIDVIDLSPVMIDAMSRVLEDPAASLKENAIVQNWLSLDLDTRKHRTYDYILGIDVLNMLNFSDMEMLLRVIAELLTEKGQFLTQVIIKPTKEEYKTRHQLINEMSLARAYELLKEQVEKGKMSVEEMFASLCYGRLGTGESVYIGGLISEIEGWEESFDETKPISKTYSLCNTTLFIPERLTIEKWMEKSFHIGEVFHESHGGADEGRANVSSAYFREYMFSYKLVKNRRDH